MSVAIHCIVSNYNSIWLPAQTFLGFCPRGGEDCVTSIRTSAWEPYAVLGMIDELGSMNAKQK